MNDKKDNPGVIAPPPLIFLSGLLLGGALSWYIPDEFLPHMVGYVLGSSLVLAGLAIIFIAKLKMAKIGTNIEPWKPTTAILDDGIYGFSRNPIYGALVLIYFGIACLFNSLLVLPPLILVVLVVHFGVIVREEKYLEQKFGEEYLKYQKKVRRWI